MKELAFLVVAAGLGVIVLVGWVVFTSWYEMRKLERKVREKQEREHKDDL
jgi:heme exporter protein D